MYVLQVTVFTLLSALSVMLSLAGSILSCQNGQLVKSFNSCKKENNWCICCHPAIQPEAPSDCGELEKLTLYPNHQCDSIRTALKVTYHLSGMLLSLVGGVGQVEYKVEAGCVLKVSAGKW
ncbi:unnamed protein product [Staurois parvus]|uniref:Uncharacterized protein n=1 Tax=Staurois parvus TaxID=386267 RepID=A0ABN9DX04_9NEOB|nr:unnamed protein product [Staurois parvus]